MAQIATLTPSGYGLAAVLRSRLLAVGKTVTALVDSQPIRQQVNHLSSLTDAELAAHGLTRAGEARRILGAHLYM